MAPTMKILSAVAALQAGVMGISLDTKDPDSIKSAASTIAYDMLKTYYTGNTTKDQIGLLPQPHYWWEAGAMWGGLVDYWAYTGDDSYVETVGQAIVAQSSPTTDFMMENQHFDLGNDDQGFWALTAMSAAEEGLPVPSGTDAEQWKNLCVNTFNEFTGRWNTTQCNGGLKWQIFTSNKGYDYKSAIANGVFFQLAARLAHLTGNETYSDWAGKVYDWMSDIGYIDPKGAVYDGAGDLDGCKTLDHSEWSYNIAAMTYGSAVMYNVTKNSTWQKRTDTFVDYATTKFFGPDANSKDVMFEQNCETKGTCNNDQFSFKAYLSRWLAKSTVVYPSLDSKITPLLETSAKAAAQSCSGESGTTCGTKWYVKGWDGVKGVGQQLSAMETIQALLVHSAKPASTTSGSAAKSPKKTGDSPRQGTMKKFIA